MCANVDPRGLPQRRGVRTLGWCLHPLIRTRTHTHTHTHTHSHTRTPRPARPSAPPALRALGASLPASLLPSFASGSRYVRAAAPRCKTVRTHRREPRLVRLPGRFAFSRALYFWEHLSFPGVPRGLGRPCHLPCLLATRIWDSCTRAHAVRVQCPEVAPEGSAGSGEGVGWTRTARGLLHGSWKPGPTAFRSAPRPRNCWSAERGPSP